MTNTNDLIEQIVETVGDVSSLEKYAFRKMLRSLVILAQAERLSMQLDMLKVEAIAEASKPN